jgi:hypothetical protein
MTSSREQKQMKFLGREQRKRRFKDKIQNKTLLSWQRINPKEMLCGFPVLFRK